MVILLGYLNHFNVIMIMVVAAAGGCVIMLFLMNNNNKNNKNLLPPGSYGWPLLGETLEFLRAGKNGKPGEFVKTRMRKYGSPAVFKTSLMGNQVAVFCSPAGNKFLFANENKLVQVWWPESTRRLLGRCLSTTVGDEAKRTRKMLYSFFAPDALMRYTNIVDIFTRRHLLTHWQGKEEVQVFPTVKKYTFELACRLFLSLEDENHIAKLASLFSVFLKGVISIPLNIPGTRFGRAIRATEAVRKELMIIVKDRKLDLKQRNKDYVASNQDLLSYLMLCADDNGVFITETEIVNNVMLLLFAGHDTSSVSITLLMKKLAELPHVYDKVLREQQDIASAKKDGELLKWEDIQKMKYSWNVMCEVFRQQPPIMGAFREAMADLSFEGYVIPKGWKLYWNATLTSNSDSENFDPSRFDGAGPPPPPFSYVPFGGGARMCLGKEYARVEILVFLHNVINKFRWNLIVPNENVIYDPLPTPIHGLPICLSSHTFY